jgi:hypothetical protein
MEFAGVTVGQVYASFNASEALSFNGSFTYWMSNWEDETALLWEDATGWEIDAGMAYKITDATTYSAAAGFAQVDLEDGANAGDDDPDGAYRIYHKIAIAF